MEDEYIPDIDAARYYLEIQDRNLHPEGTWTAHGEFQKNPRCRTLGCQFIERKETRWPYINYEHRRDVNAAVEMYGINFARVARMQNLLKKGLEPTLEQLKSIVAMDRMEGFEISVARAARFIKATKDFKKGGSDGKVSG